MRRSSLGLPFSTGGPKDRCGYQHVENKDDEVIEEVFSRPLQTSTLGAGTCAETRIVYVLLEHVGPFSD